MGSGDHESRQGVQGLEHGAGGERHHRRHHHVVEDALDPLVEPIGDLAAEWSDDMTEEGDGDAENSHAEE